MKSKQRVQPARQLRVLATEAEWVDSVGKAPTYVCD